MSLFLTEYIVTAAILVYLARLSQQEVLFLKLRLNLHTCYFDLTTENDRFVFIRYMLKILKYT